VGHVLVALRTDLFLPDQIFRERMDAILQMLKASPPSPGTQRVLVPGEIEFAHEATAIARGIALAVPVAAQLTSFGAELGVTFPSPIAQTVKTESFSA
jgi:LDH2 family malate/lactate/ureidoglycolate dehydrogenase